MRSIKQVYPHEKRVDLPLAEVENFSYKSGELIVEGKGMNRGSKTGCIVSFFNTSGEKIGYINFFIYPETCSLEMRGLMVYPYFRGMGYSHVLLDELDSIASRAGLSFNKTNRQRKPLTCLVLQKRGFSSLCQQIKGSRVYVGRLFNEESGVGLFFEDRQKAKHYSGSRKMRSQNVSLVSSLEELRDVVQIALGSRYVRPEHIK